MDSKNLVLNIKEMVNEYKLLEKEIERLDELYEEVRNEKNENKNSGSRKSPVFISNQNSTLNSIASNRISVISKMSDIIRIMNELQIKEYTANKSNNSEEGSNQQVIKDLFNMVMNKEIKEIIDTVEDRDNDDQEVIESGDLLDDLLDQFDIDEDGKVFEKDVEVVKQTEEELLEIGQRFLDILFNYNMEAVINNDNNDIVFLSTLKDDEGTIILDEYISKISDLVDIIENDLKIISKENGIAKTNLGIELEAVVLND